MVGGWWFMIIGWYQLKSAFNPTTDHQPPTTNHHHDYGNH
jgi:hypothetical protein